MSIGFTELLLIVAIAALLFGGRRIAQLGSDLGRGAGRLKRGLEEKAAASQEVDEHGKPTWVKTAVEVVETAKEVRKATSAVRKLPFN